jgi:hypothetical protein
MPVRFGQKLNEAQVTQQIRGFMESHGWRPIRNQRTVIPGAFQSCEPGTPDFLFLRYLPNGVCLALWIELKAKNARIVCRCSQVAGTRRRCTPCDQKAWRQREKARGAVVWQVDDLDWFLQEYQEFYGWLHTGESGRGQLDLLAGARS